MTKYFGPAIIGILVTIILGIFVTPFLSVIVGGLIAGIMCKGGASGGAGVGFLLGIISAIPFFIMAGVIGSSVPFVGAIIGGRGAIARTIWRKAHPRQGGAAPPSRMSASPSRNTFGDRRLDPNGRLHYASLFVAPAFLNQ